jgi:hypothetical protein
VEENKPEESTFGLGAGLVLLVVVVGILWVCMSGLTKDPEAATKTYRQTDPNGREWEVTVRHRPPPR